MPSIEADDDSVRAYGRLVDDPESFQVEIVRRPDEGWRPVEDAQRFLGS